MNYYVTPTTAPHVADLLADVRKEDAAEAWGAMHWTPYDALRSCIDHTKHVFSGMVDDTPLCIFGIAPRSMISPIGVPWMMSSNALATHSVAWIRHNREVFTAFSAGWDRLENYVDSRYTKAVRWAGWLGFEVEDARPYGRDDVLFHKITMEL